MIWKIPFFGPIVGTLTIFIFYVPGLVYTYHPSSQSTRRPHCIHSDVYDLRQFSRRKLSHGSYYHRGLLCCDCGCYAVLCVNMGTPYSPSPSPLTLKPVDALALTTTPTHIFRFLASHFAYATVHGDDHDCYKTLIVSSSKKQSQDPWNQSRGVSQIATLNIVNRS